MDYNSFLCSIYDTYVLAWVGSSHLLRFCTVTGDFHGSSSELSVFGSVSFCFLHRFGVLRTVVPYTEVVALTGASSSFVWSPSGLAPSIILLILNS